MNLFEVLENIKLSDEDKTRLFEIVAEMNNDIKDFYNCLSFQEEEKLRDRGLQNALYLLTDDDTIDDTGHYEHKDIPYHLAEAGHNVELKELLRDVPMECRIYTGYHRVRINDGIQIDELYSDSEWELSGADVLTTLFNFKEYSDAEELAEALKVGEYYYHDTIQIHYVMLFSDIEYAISQDDELSNNKDRIIELIAFLGEIDEKRYQEFKTKLLDEAV